MKDTWFRSILCPTISMFSTFFIFEYTNSFSLEYLSIHAAESPTCKRASEMSAVILPAIVIADRVQTNVSDDLRRESPSDSGSISSRLR
jgi:hypothetical protein